MFGDLCIKDVLFSALSGGSRIMLSDKCLHCFEVEVEEQDLCLVVYLVIHMF